LTAERHIGYHAARDIPRLQPQFSMPIVGERLI
jgi:hypothetical protein